MKTIISLIVVLFSVSVWAGDFNNSPNNWDNSPNNWENSPNNWENSPNNWENSPNKYGNDRILRDADGNAVGYVVPKDDGGANVYNLEGERKAYLPPKENE